MALRHENIAKITIPTRIWNMDEEEKGDGTMENQTNEPIISCSNLSFAYGQEEVLRNVSFDVYSHDFLAVIGPNGGGKSTLMKLMLGLLKPKSGEISYAKDLNHKIGYVPQDTGINKDFPIQVIDVVKMGFLKSKAFGFRTSYLQNKRAYEILNRLEIAHLAKCKISEISGGQLQRVLIARALCGDPEILMLDEPTSNIDTKSQKEIYDLLKFFNNFYPIIVISHNISILLGYASRVLSVNREVVVHNMPQVVMPNQGHICEIDILNQILESRK